jgi:tetratricopeptide (TPR) repeat protein
LVDVTKNQFIEYIRQPSSLDENTVDSLTQLISNYPYFPVLRMLYLRNLKNIGSHLFEQELREQAVFIPDRKILFKYLNYNDMEEPFRLLDIPGETGVEKNVQGENQSSNDIDAVINAYSSSFDLQEQVEAEPQLDPNNLIDRFIMESPGKIKPGIPENKTPDRSEKDDEEKVDDGLISETLAEIYMAQGLYDEALKAYEKLSLKIPEKNSYFATQIEKIKNLISKDS